MSWTLERCPCCPARVGEAHAPGCGVEQCPYCGGALAHCPCGRTPGAGEDLERLHEEARWDPVQKRFVLPASPVPPADGG